MSAFNPAGLVIEYGQLDTLLTDGQTPGSHADDLFLNMLDQYDQATGSDGYFDHDGMVDELLDALNRRLNPIGLEASRSGVVYCNVMGAPDLHEVVGAVEAFMDEDWDGITQRYDASGLIADVQDLLDEYDLSHGNSDVLLQGGELGVNVEAPNHTIICLHVPITESDEETIGNLKAKMIAQMGRFDADEEFNELWSREFAEHNGFTPSGFMRMLQKDEEHFHFVGFRLAMDARPSLRDLWYSDAQLEGVNYTEGYRQTIDADQVMQDGKPAYEKYLFTVSTGDPETSRATDLLSEYDFYPEQMAAFITSEFEDPDHASREKPAKDNEQGVSLKDEADASRDASDALGGGHDAPFNEHRMDR